MMTDTVRKRLLRQEAEARRSALSESERQAKSEIICREAVRYLAGKPALLSGGRVFFMYLPFRSEVDVTPLMRWSWNQGIPVVVPRVNRRTKEMDLAVISSIEEVKENGPWGIREPESSCPILDELERIGCILMPGLAFDKQKRRLGYGGGYYDRFLAKLEQNSLPLPLRIALSFDVQVIPEVPEEKHDYRIDVLITETAVIQ